MKKSSVKKYGILCFVCWFVGYCLFFSPFDRYDVDGKHR